MKPEQIIKAWKDPTYRASLSAEERAQLPENPAGTVELDDAQLGDISGAGKKSVLCTDASLCGSASIICASSICPTHLTCGGTLCGPIVIK
jgi:mersacidin/lichenicidin family type 2 lantibiotic